MQLESTDNVLAYILPLLSNIPPQKGKTLKQHKEARDSRLPAIWQLGNRYIIYPLMEFPSINKETDHYIIKT